MLNTDVLYLPINEVGRDFAVGDIHGSFSALRRALAMVHFDPACDRLISVGDLVDRGPESDEVLAWLDKPWFYAVTGNHDFMAWRRALGTPYEAVDHLTQGGRWLDVCTPDEQRRIGERLSALPLAIEVATAEGPVGIMHADTPCADWQDVTEGRLRAHQLHMALWSYERMRQRDHTPVANVRAVIHGHTTVDAMRILGNSFFIDTGGWREGGTFTLLDLHSLTPSLGPQPKPTPPKTAAD